MQGLRVHITGSAARSAEGPLLEAAHDFVSALVGRLVNRGAGLVVGIGDEPLGSKGLPCIFDWTVLDPHFPYQPCRACRHQQRNYPM